jgi:hypothetical protein
MKLHQLIFTDNLTGSEMVIFCISFSYDRGILKTYHLTSPKEIMRFATGKVKVTTHPEKIKSQ